MKTLAPILLFGLIVMLFIFEQAQAQGPVIIDHKCTDVTKIPDEWIAKAKNDLHIFYGHTSHGSHLVTGGLATLLRYYGGSSRYNYGNSSTDGSMLYLVEDYDNNDITKENWVQPTIDYLDTNPGCNVVMWAWCSFGVETSVVEAYIVDMETLISNYPDVTFVFMTGHNDHGETEEIVVTRKLIKEHCVANNRVLFDFTDIEAWNPDGDFFGDWDTITNELLDRSERYFLAEDISYNMDGASTPEGNWGLEWESENPDTDLAKMAKNEYCTDCAHSNGDDGRGYNSRIHCVLKGSALWWLSARLAGWNPGGASLNISSVTQLSEANLDEASITIVLTNETFSDDNLSPSNFQLNNIPGGCSIESITYNNEYQATLNLAFDGTDFDNDISNFSLTIISAELTGSENLTSNSLFITAIDEDAPSASISTSSDLNETNLDDASITIELTNETFGDDNLLSSNFQLNNAPEGCVIESATYINDYQVIIELSFDGTDFDEDIDNFSINILAAELIGNADLTSNNLSIEAIVEGPPIANLSVENELRENSLDGAVLKISLDNVSFFPSCVSSGTFILCNVPSGVTIFNVECRSSNDKEVLITLSFDGTDFEEDSANFCILIDKSALKNGVELKTNTLTIHAEVESNISNLKNDRVLKVFPNPLKDIVTIEFDPVSEKGIRFELIDLTGKKLIEKEYNGGHFKREETLDLRRLKKGSYYLIFLYGDKRIIETLIKE